MPSNPGRHKPRGKLIMVNIPSTDNKKSTEFYRTLLGTDFARSIYHREHYHAPASAGVQLDISAPYTDGQPMMAQFAVANLDETVKALEAQGGKVLQRNLELRVEDEHRRALGVKWKDHYGSDIGQSMGKSAIMMDPSGNIIGLSQLEEWAEVSFRDGHLKDTELARHLVAMRTGQELRTK